MEKQFLMKSRSSNKAIVSKKSDWKSSSNAEIKPHMLKKRGVYVEKKTTTEPVFSKRRGRKQFLNSVLTILSKSTTGTQYPDMNDIANKRNKKKKECNNPNDGYTVSKPKPKFRSKVLNDTYDLEEEDVLVLQSKKIINQTPSNFSEISRDQAQVKWSDFSQPISKEDFKTNNKHETDNAKENKQKLERTPTATLVADQPKQDKQLYNFFVDLLKTTISVYNVKTGHIDKLSSKDSSKLDFEIDEFIANKLKMEPSRSGLKNYKNTTKLKMESSKTALNYYDDVSPGNIYDIKPQEHKELGNPMDIDEILLEDHDIIYKKASLTDMATERHTPKSQSFQYKKKKLIPVCRSQIQPKAVKLSKKQRKKNILDLLKKELRKDIEKDIYEEPQNFFQALKAMAENKKRNQKSIHFDLNAKSSDNSECIFKRRRLISVGKKTKKTKRNKSNSNKYQPFQAFKRRLPDNFTPKFDSSHSLTVFGFDYEDNPQQPSWDAYDKDQASEITSSDESVIDSVVENNNYIPFSVQDTV